MTTKHGHSVTKTTPTYNSWAGMFQRCNNQKNPAYTRYGGRGIAVCSQWQGADGFARFLSDMGVRPEGKTLDREDADGNYEPVNCRWATPQQQSENKRNNVLVTIDGETQPLSFWCEAFGIEYKTASNRIHLGWDPVKSVSHPKVFDLKPFGLLDITVGDETKTLNEWCLINGIKYRTAYSRIYQQGWSHEKAVTVPSGPNGSSCSKRAIGGHKIVVREVLMDL